ncbi:chemotaxis protein CheD [Roseateles sp. PN1]|uniref:chemotaxis protein CheD n=1 Tax=Roseateles sp. PN1 TaxID=3137372 RepID=UPI00313A3B3C
MTKPFVRPPTPPSGAAPKRAMAPIAPPAAAVPAAPGAPGASAILVPKVLHLMPGQWHFGQGLQLRTLLGSCVAITLWHPSKRIGGMCHFLLPSRASRGQAPLDGRYGDEAVELLLQSIKQSGAQPKDFLAHLYGGADTMPDGANVKFNVGQRNIERGWALIDQHGFQLQDVDVGDFVPRTVTLDLPSGKVEIKRGAASR